MLRESDLPGIYYECKQTTELNNVDSLALLIAAEYNLPRPAFRSIEETLDFLFQKACRENMIFVLDEYSYLRDCVKGMDSILQALLGFFLCSVLPKNFILLPCLPCGSLSNQYNIGK